MKTTNLNFWGTTRKWWIVLIIGLGLVAAGCAYFIWPTIGYPVASQIFGWLMVLAGIVALCVSAGKNRPAGWGWWLVCGVINMFVGFMLVRSVVLSEIVFPYFIALVCAMWGIGAIFSSVSQRERRYWWIYLINGLLLLAISFLLIEAGYTAEAEMVSILVSVAFVYWGATLSMVSLDMRPIEIEE